MIVDTSALIAILFEEDDRETFVQALASAPEIHVSAATVVEASVVALGRHNDLDNALTTLLEQIGAIIIPVSADQIEHARDGLRRYGKGRHKARLNLGDSFAYALAMDRDEPLLFKGRDFIETDVKRAL